MSTVSVKPLDTLKGVFSVPKMDRNRRNFLKENKLSLRELQRVTSKNRLTQQQEQQQRDQKYLNRRSMSQQRGHVAELKASPLPRYPSCTRPPSSHGVAAGAIGSVNGSNDSFGRFSRRGLTRNGSATTIVSCDKQIQTEDIHDEEFLYDALKKCTANEYRSNGLQPIPMTRRSRTSVAKAVQHSDYADTASKQQPYYPQQMEEVEQLPLESELDPQYAQEQYQPSEEEPPDHNNYYDEREPLGNSSSKYNFPPTERSQPYALNGFNENGNEAMASQCEAEQEQQYHQESQQHEHQLHQQHHQAQRSTLQEDLRNNYENMSLNNNSHVVDAPQPQSGRSRRTNFTQGAQHGYELSKKRSTGSVHKLGSRDDVRLPRYLEREKREKEDQRQREKERDPNCPEGHYALPESERAAALKTAETRFKALVGELNRMPMTTETLRMRNRKAEIEKELKLLETDIRIFSKTKVYVRHQD